MRARLVSVTAAGCLLVAAGGMAASASPRRSTRGAARPIGGPLLGSSGVVVRPGRGAPALPPASQLPASSWMVTNLTTGQVLAAKDAHGKFLPASTLKTLTAVTLIPKLRPDAMEPISFRDENVDGTRVGLVTSLKYTVRKLFTCMLIVSANDAADALAEANGGLPRTLREMNAKAHHLQAFDTVAKTPSGLDAVGESTSAYDLALIAQAGLKMPAFRHYISIDRSSVPAPHHHHFAISNHNELLETYRGDIGVKNGYTVAAQGTDVQAATRHGQTIVVTLMHAYPDFWPMARTLLNWGFQANGKVTPVGTLVQPLSKKPVAHNVSAPAPSRPTVASTASHGTSFRIPGLRYEGIAAAVIVALWAMALVQRRRVRRRRNNRYRTRLRLPPI